MVAIVMVAVVEVLVVGAAVVVVVLVVPRYRRRHYSATRAQMGSCKCSIVGETVAAAAPST